MYDYDATLKKFFNSVIRYLDMRAKVAKDVDIYQQILKAKSVVERVMENPVKYADYNARVNAGLDSTAVIDGFMAGTRDNSVLRLYESVLFKMEKLHSQFEWERTDAQQVLANAVRQMEYKNSTNLLKDFYYPFLSANRFLVKTK